MKKHGNMPSRSHVNVILRIATKQNDRTSAVGTLKIRPSALRFMYRATWAVSKTNHDMSR